MDEGGDRDQDRDRNREGVVAGARARAARLLGGRPVTVYVVLAAGILVLLFLLAIVWFSATNGGDRGERPSCFNIELADVLNAVKANQVERVDVTLDHDRPEFGPVLIEFGLTDSTCRLLNPQGITGVDRAYTVLGAIGFHNEIAEQRVRVHYKRASVPTTLLVPPTPTPTATAPPAPPGSPPAAPPTPTLAPTVAPTPVPTVAVPIVVSPGASPVPGKASASPASG